MRHVRFRPQAEAEVLEVRDWYDARRATLHRFPYAIYFRPLGDDVIVLAVHGRQDPRRWQSRA